MSAVTSLTMPLTDTLDVWHAAVVDAPVFVQFLGVSGRGDVRLRKVA